MEDLIYTYHAEMCKVFSHPKRLELIDVLRNKEMSVNELAEDLKLVPSNLSQHLAMMRERRILVTRKVGGAVFYRVANPKLLQIFDMLRELLFEQIRQDSLLIQSNENTSPISNQN